MSELIQGFQDLRDGFEDLVGLIQDTSDKLQLGTGGMAELEQVISQLQVQFDRVAVIKDWLRDEQEVLQVVIDLSLATNKVLLEIIEALGSGDKVLLIDLLIYELKGQIELWLQVSEEISSQLN